MKLRFFNEGDASCDSGASSASVGDISGVNTSAGSNIVNYGPNNLYFSNLASYKKKNKKDHKPVKLKNKIKGQGDIFPQTRAILKDIMVNKMGQIAIKSHRGGL